MSIAAVAAEQAAALSNSPSSSSTQNGLSSLSSNFNSFLTLLMTQLRNQDPTQPLSSDQFTTELVQFAGVQQQINTNSSLTQLISLTQGGEILQASQMMGRTVTVTSNQLALQNGTATIGFNSATQQPVSIEVLSAQGSVLHTETLQAEAGSNSWTWNGLIDSSGATAADGAYQVVVTTTGADGTSQPLATTTTGVVTGVAANGQNINVKLGALSAAMAAIQLIK